MAGAIYRLTTVENEPRQKWKSNKYSLKFNYKSPNRQNIISFSICTWRQTLTATRTSTPNHIRIPDECVEAWKIENPSLNKYNFAGNDLNGKKRAEWRFSFVFIRRIAIFHFYEFLLLTEIFVLSHCTVLWWTVLDFESGQSLIQFRCCTNIAILDFRFSFLVCVCVCRLPIVIFFFVQFTANCLSSFGLCVGIELNCVVYWHVECLLKNLMDLTTISRNANLSIMISVCCFRQNRILSNLECVHYMYQKKYQATRQSNLYLHTHTQSHHIPTSDTPFNAPHYVRCEHYSSLFFPFQF